ncbi:outer membrane beta-barrel protein [Chitinophaga agrisoli]|uniref:Outer membrane beta-barrel protein n=1 Tax=Chitinophaga agrisoli TaxID=2607653 RepID=A0A5B2VK62_9BACT|nr:outer membrane beta-barrel family protein [Chitinophaga agrisoli]KAA2238627.1 outer membrane beta-barrel protein [Chitinophaga agrisoli]
MKLTLTKVIPGLAGIAMLFIANVSSGQIAVSGKIIDSSTNSALELVTVRLQSAAMQEKVVSSDSAGGYTFTGLQPGRYKLVLSFINFTERILPLNLGKDTIVNLSLSRSSRQLNAVNVNARKPVLERKIDRLIFNVSNNINVIGSDALEVLSHTPQVKVDGNSISIIGKEGVTIMINDRPLQLGPEARAAYLKSIPAESVERIEVMTNPPAMYSAQGSSGIVNIVLKKKKDPGYSGTANLNLSKSKSGGASGGVNLNYNSGKMRYFGSINSAKGAHIPTYNRTVFYESQTQQESTETKELSQFVNGEAGFDADLSTTSSLGASVNFFYSYPYQTNTVRALFIDNKDKLPDSISEQHNREKVAYRSISSNIHYAKAFDTLNRKRLVVDADWAATSFDRPNMIDNILYGADGNPLPGRFSSTISSNAQSTDLYSLNGVVYLPGRQDELSFGGRVNFIKNTNDVLLDVSGDGAAHINNKNLFTFNENTQALFVNYKTDLGSHWSFQSGLRGEYTQTKGHSYTIPDSIHTNAYFNLFPTIYLLYKLNSKHTLTLNYGRRINRPGFNSFNPYRQYYSQYQYGEGNPLLQPSISNNFSLSETYNDNLNISLQYSYSNDQTGVISLVQDNTRTTVLKFFNFLSTRSALLSVNYTIDKIKWFQSINEFDLYYNRSVSSLGYTAPEISGWGAAFSSDNSFFFNSAKTFAGGVYFSYQFPDVSGIYNNARYYYFDVSARYLLLKSKLQVAIKLSDLFKTRNVSSQYLVNGILTTDMSNNDSRRVTLSLRYNFGNNRLKKGQAHSAETNKGRAGS